MPYQRKYDFQPGTRASSSQVDEEFDNLMNAVNTLESDKANSLDVYVKTDYTNGTGWRKTPDGFIEQWGTITYNATNAGTWLGLYNYLFPISFTSGVEVINATLDCGGTNQYGQVGIGKYDNTKFHIYLKPETTGQFTINWRALGK